VKILFFILALYLLALPVVPCNDGSECDSESSDLATLAAFPGHDEQDEEETESCTPFCYCACCSYSALLHIPISHAHLIMMINSPAGQFQNGLDLFEARTIWQPPRMLG